MKWIKKTANKLINKLLTKLSLRLISEQEKKMNLLLKLKEELMETQWNAERLNKLTPDESIKELIYIDKNGNKWYTLTNYLNISMERFTNIQVAERYLQMNITQEKLLEIAKLMKEKFDNSSWVELGSLIAELITRSQFQAEKEMYIIYMSLVFLINDETTKHDKDLYNKKIEIIKNDEELFCFFLRELVERFNLFTANYNQILDYLTMTEEMKMKLEMLRNPSS